MHDITHLAANNELKQKKLFSRPLIHESSTVIHSRFGEYTEIEAGCFCNEITLGDYSYLSSCVRAIWCDIGRFSSIASHCVINPGNHPYQRVTQSHCTYRCRQYGFADQDDAAFFEWRRQDAVTIGHDVWLGHGVYVMPGAKIATGAVVAAGSVVTRNRPVGPYEIAAGSPAKPVKKRFSDRIIDRLLEIRFWDWPREKLEQRFRDLYDVEAFIEKY
ncbi:acetyltransferase [Desulfotignum balticum]|jgi:phosphonate metabolism protein (transferase hexapeptide repeat family)|uniref:acetyltransferase n=1 Tax=Desulfotignum balticum TaxID=115781 RepID=UPI00040D14BE|nr:acetyltransferase [Desulfotignum balticum]